MLWGTITFMAATKEAVGTLEAGKWVHVKFPLELIYNRADKNIKANNATVMLTHSDDI